MYPQLYHAHNSIDSDDLHFWHQLTQSIGGAILELGCGTGRVLSYLAQTSAPVYGLDYSFEMLQYLKSVTPPAILENMRVFQGDFTSFHLRMRFALILMPCNTYSTLSAHQRIEVLERVHFHLHPNGIFAVSMPNPVSLKHLPHKSALELEEVFSHPADGEPVQVSSAWKRSGNQISITWVYDHLQPNGSIDRHQYDDTQHIIPKEAILHEFKSAGLKVMQIFGEFDGSPYTEDSAHLILVSARV